MTGDETPSNDAVIDRNRIDIYLDGDSEPLVSYRPPLRFELDTSQLQDGPHLLRVEAFDSSGTKGVREIPFTVRNGPGIAISGIRDNDVLEGSIPVLVNSYGGAVEQNWEPSRAETPAPAPTWAWVLLIVFVAFTGFYGVRQWNPPAGFASTPTYGLASAGVGATSSDDSMATATAGDARAGQAPVADPPVVHDPVADPPVVDDPIADPLVADDPVADDPIVDPLVADDPIADAPIADAPVVHPPTEASVDEPLAQTREAPAEPDAAAAESESGAPAAVQTDGERASTAPVQFDSELGASVYGSYCSACHQANGQGLPGVFPPMAGDPVVLDQDPSEHVRIVLHGLQGATIDGVAYASPMPAFANQLTDEQIAAVINHERSSWGNDAPLVSPEDVAELR